MNKKQLCQKVEAAGCSVEIDLFDGRYKTVYITAPKGMNFGGESRVDNCMVKRDGGGII